MSAIAVENVWKFYGDYPALRDISFRVEAGACLAMLGRNGAGKTTLLKILAGLSRPAKGTVAMPPRNKVGVLGHGIGIYEELSAYENLMIFAGLFGVPNPKSAAMEWLTRTNLDKVKDSAVREFSRGMRQRLAVARTFLHNPSILLLDEPFTALDDRAIALLQGLLRDAKRGGATIVMSTHQLREALELATDVLLIQGGKLAFRGERTGQMVADPAYIYRTYGEA